MEQTKLNTFIGFAIKARKAKLGVNAVKTLKRADLLILCSTSSENTLKESVSLSKKLNAKLYILKEIKLEDVVFKENCKLFKFGREGTFTLKQVWNNIQIIQINYYDA